MIIGLTGGIGSGKSVVGGMLRELGAYVIDTDKVGHRVYEPDSEGWKKIVEAFGTEVVAADRTIDRKKLGAMVFADEARRKTLNGIVHPMIFQEIIGEIAAQRDAGFQGHIVLEAPILVEAKGTGMVDCIWVVVAPRPVIEARLVSGRDMTPEEIAARMNVQLDDATRRKHADLVIENDADLVALRANVEAAWRTL